MWYSLVCTDISNSLALRKATRPAHLQRLEALRDAGRLLVAGPNPSIDSEDPGEAGFSGSIIIAEFDSLKAAEEWAAQDPYQAAGVYASVSVKAYKKVLP
ncbi:MAG: YciI family protein [Candidatus Reddybacter sp.]